MEKVYPKGEEKSIKEGCHRTACVFKERVENRVKTSKEIKKNKEENVSIGLSTWWSLETLSGADLWAWTPDYC